MFSSHARSGVHPEHPKSSQTDAVGYLPLIVATSRGSILVLNSFSNTSVMRIIVAYEGLEALVSIRDIVVPEIRAFCASFCCPQKAYFVECSKKSWIRLSTNTRLIERRRIGLGSRLMNCSRSELIWEFTTKWTPLVAGSDRNTREICEYVEAFSFTQLSLHDQRREIS